MPTKDQLRTDALLDRGMTRVADPITGRHSLSTDAVDKTPLMLYIEGVTGLSIKAILLKQMSTRRLAEWLIPQIGRPITQATIVQWRKRYAIKKIRKY